MKIGFTWASVFFTLDDLTGVRAKNTVYQNTTGKVLFVSVSVQNADTNRVELDCATHTPPNAVVAQVLATAPTECLNLSCMVPPNYYYQLYQGGTALVTIKRWVEWY
jgi:hypothetical protein